MESEFFLVVRFNRFDRRENSLAKAVINDKWVFGRESELLILLMIPNCHPSSNIIHYNSLLIYSVRHRVQA